MPLSWLQSMQHAVATDPATSDLPTSQKDLLLKVGLSTVAVMPRKAKQLLQGLAQTWDGCEIVRARLRAEKCLLTGSTPTFHPTVKSCSENCEQLIPVLEMTKEMLNLIMFNL